MKAIFAATLLVCLPGPDYEKMLAEARFPLAEAVDKGLKEAKEGVVIKVQIEIEKGKTIYTLDIAQGDKILEINFDVKDGAVVERKIENEDKSKIAAAAKTTLKQAIEASLKKAEGKAVSAAVRLNKDGKAEFEVTVFKGGKLTAVAVSGDKGEVTGTKEVKPLAKKPGLMGIQGETSEGGVLITGLMAGMPAEKAGLKKDDLIISANGKQVKSLNELRDVISEAGEGAKIKIEYKRAGVAGDVTLTLAAAPDEEEDEGEEEEKDGK